MDTDSGKELPGEIAACGYSGMLPDAYPVSPGGHMNLRHLGTSKATTGIILFLIVSVLAVYWQTSNHAFIEYDDQLYLLENRHVSSGLSLDNIKWAFTTAYAANWHPLTWISHMLDVQLFGMNPSGHHLSSVFLHALNTILLFSLLARITGALWKSALVAALFALHPLHVESVAWIAERKDVLSSSFWIITLHLYRGYVNRPTICRYSAVIIAFILGLMSKPMLVSLPALLLLLDFWPLRRPALWSGESLSATHTPAVRNILLEKLPFLLIAALASVITIQAQNLGNAMTSLTVSPLAERIENALIAYPAYLGKMLWPIDLALPYPFHAGFSLWQSLAGAILLAAITVFALFKRRSSPYLLFGWLWFLITLAPVIGIVRVGLQSMADRYTYMPLTGIFIMLVWGGDDLLHDCSMVRKKLACTLAAGVIAACLLLSRQQVSYWKDTPTLFTHTLMTTENNYLAHSVLGRHLERAGRLEEALGRYNQALAIAPWYEFARIHQGDIMVNQGRLAAAVSNYSTAINENPASVPARINLGIALALQNRPEEAIRNFRMALAVSPLAKPAHYNLGMELVKTGKYAEAIQHYKLALEIDPEDVNCLNNLGIALAETGRLHEALSYFTAALELKPDFFDAHNNRELLRKKLAATPAPHP